MTQTTKAVPRACGKLWISTDNFIWIDISGQSQSVDGTDQNRIFEKFYSFDVDRATVRNGRPEPMELNFVVIYTEDDEEIYERARAVFESATSRTFYVRWSPAGGGIGDKILTSVGSILNGFTYPPIDASAGGPIMGGFRVIAPALSTADMAYSDSIISVFGDSLIGYWPLWDAVGATAADDASGQAADGTPSNVTFGATGIGDGRTAASFNGTTSYVGIYSSALAAAFNAPAGTIMAWPKIANAGVWADATERRIVKIGADSNNVITINKTTIANQMRVAYRAGGGTLRQVTWSTSLTNFFQVAVTWDQTAGQLKAYFQGAQTGTTQAGSGTWAGVLTSSNCVIGALDTTPANLWSGSVAHVAIGNRVLTAAEIATLFTVT